MKTAAFQALVWRHTSEHVRHFPWRETHDPYAITVSEFMLQQTQAERVVPKYELFLRELPTWKALAECETTQLLSLWQGLGYNRRALNLRRAAQVIVTNYDGKMPSDPKALVALPGVGPYTAGAIQAFAFNLPVTMIETNIRRVYLHHFFPNDEKVTDADLLPIITKSVDAARPREWYWALMDYGSWLGKNLPNANVRSKHYTKQSAFTGSLRQVRGQIVKLATKQPVFTITDLATATGQAPERLQQALTGLLKDGFLEQKGEEYRVAP